MMRFNHLRCGRPKHSVERERIRVAFVVETHDASVMSVEAEDL